MGDLIAIVAIVLILGSSIGYIVKAKRSGVHCIGCPTGSSCSGHCSSQENAVLESVNEKISEQVTGCGCSTEGECNCSSGGCSCASN